MRESCVQGQQLSKGPLHAQSRHSSDYSIVRLSPRTPPGRPLRPLQASSSTANTTMVRPPLFLLARIASRPGPSTYSARQASSRALPKLPYDPLRPLSPEHPPPVQPGFVHPLAKWDTFLDIRASHLPLLF